MPSPYELMTVDLPEGELDGLRIKKIEVTGNSVRDFRLALTGRDTAPGTYTALVDGGTLWMSDTDAEKRDHIPAVYRMQDPDCRRVLINGLGLGMVLKAALAQPHIEHVDVVEIDRRVIDLVGPHYADSRLAVHHADAYEQASAWPAGTRWDVIWHDIWPDICAGNLPRMARLHRSYGRRTAWQGSWSKEDCEYQRDQYRRQQQRLAAFYR